MRRNILALLLAVMMAATLLTACGGSASTPASASESASASGSESAPAEEPLRVGMECDYAPNNWQENAPTDTNLPIENLPGAYAEGYDVQVARMIGEALGREVVVQKLAWDGLIEALNAGQIDMIIAGMADTETRKQSVAFSLTYKPTEYVIMVQGDGPYASATRLEDFEGAAILGQKDTKYDEVIDQIPGVNHLTPVENVPNMLARLEQNACDGIVVGKDNAAAYLNTYPQFAMVRFEEGFELGFTGSCVGLRLEDTELLEQVNAVIEPLTQEDFTAMIDKAIEQMPK